MIRHIRPPFFLGIWLILGAELFSAEVGEDPLSQESLLVSSEEMEAQHVASLQALKSEILASLPVLDKRDQTILLEVQAAVKDASVEAEKAKKKLQEVLAAKGLVNHAKRKWIAGAEAEIAQAEVALEKANNSEERQAAKSDLAKWQADRQAGIKALKEREAAYQKVMGNVPILKSSFQAAQAALEEANRTEIVSMHSVLANTQPYLTSDQLDAKLAQCVIIAQATPQGLAAFSKKGREETALINQFLDNPALMKQMLIAGGARLHQYGPAMKIYTAIQNASPKANVGHFQRLAIAVSLEHAVPIAQTNAAEQADSPSHVDPVSRYSHYEKAFLDGELDPAFANFSTWEYRHIINSDAPDEILKWGRDMLRNYRPDHVSLPDYRWRYVSSVKTEVPYNSEEAASDLNSLNPYQNIIKNGGDDERRASFGRFILRSFGIPTWGVTQKKHTALSHWTPQGWVVNFGAGFQSSSWEKDGIPISGKQFLMETQARAYKRDYLKVLRAQWTSQVLGETASYNHNKIPSGLWSRIGYFQLTALASRANHLKTFSGEKEWVKKDLIVASQEHQEMGNQDHIITIPAVARHGKAIQSIVMKSFTNEVQLHCLSGFEAQYAFDAPQAGDYHLTANVVTVHNDQKILLTVNQSTQLIEANMPYTLGMWETSKPVVIKLEKGENTLYFKREIDSRGVTIKDFILTPVT